MQAYEYIKINECENYFILCRKNALQKNNLQMLSLSKFLNIPISRMRQKRSLLLLVVASLFFSIRCDKVVFGDENSILFKIVKLFVNSSKIIMLDDGVASVNSSSTWTRFTIFPAPGCIDNDFRYLSKLIVNAKVSASEGKIIIVGGKLSEVGICTKEDYFQCLDFVINDIRLKYPKAIEIIYIPHRGESNYNCYFTQTIRERYNVKVSENELPVELVEVEFGINILLVASFISTAIFSMSLIYKEAEFVFYEIPDCHIISRKESVLGLYEYLHKNGYKVVKVNS
ncbi:hypothetical protein [Halomonas ventosae]|nr:hypothetical protein [Halomonas ventosae]